MQFFVSCYAVDAGTPGFHNFIATRIVKTGCYYLFIDMINRFQFYNHRLNKILLSLCLLVLYDFR